MELINAIAATYLAAVLLGIVGTLGVFLFIWGPFTVRFLWSEFGVHWLTALGTWWGKKRQWLKVAAGLIQRADSSSIIGKIRGLFFAVVVLGLLLFSLIVTA